MLLTTTLAGTGLTAQYFDTPDFAAIVVAQTDSEIDFDWGSGSPDASIEEDSFSVRWSGQIESQFTETYTFYVNANDGARLWVNGLLLVDQLEAAGVADAIGTIDLIAGRRYDIQFDYVENTGNASARLEWMSASSPREIVPTERLHPSGRGSLTYERFDDIPGGDVSDLTSHGRFPLSPDVA
ncbi:MAG: PA14 domain-containing protein, partial [Planctomycetaceae bacterium]